MNEETTIESKLIQFFSGVSWILSISLQSPVRSHTNTSGPGGGLTRRLQKDTQILDAH